MYIESENGERLYSLFISVHAETVSGDLQVIFVFAVQDNMLIEIAKADYSICLSWPVKYTSSIDYVK
jgi:hypothetical protein